MAKPLINGRSYDFAQIVVYALGRSIVGCTAINFSDKQEMQNNYGQGNLPVSRGFGKITCEASITLEMAEVEALQAASPSGRLQNIPEFDITVSWKDNNNDLVAHVIHNCRFMENSRSAKSGDMTIEVELPLIVSHISKIK